MLCFAFAGCAAPAQNRPNGGSATSGSGLSPAAAALRARLTNSENGLEVRRWVVADHHDGLVQALSRHAQGLPASDAALQQLKRNGLRFVRIPLHSVETLLADLGGATYDATEWHGQVVQWRPLVNRPVEAGGQAVGIDGVVQRFETGEFRLMIRCWNVQMETGPYVHLEMIARRRLAQQNDLRRLLGEHDDLEQSFPALSLDVQLEDGYAYVIAGESPEIPWPGMDPGGDRESQGAPSGRSSRERIADVGPETSPPPTLGELLLAPSAAGATRGILVLIPKIADEFFLPEQLAERANRRDRDSQRATGGT